MPQDLFLARVETAIGGRDGFADADDKGTDRAVGMAAKAVNDRCWTAGLPELSDATLEMRLDVLAREHGQKRPLVEKIEELPALDFLHPTVGPGDQGCHRNDGVQKLIVPKIHVGSDELGLLRAPPVFGFLFPHDFVPTAIPCAPRELGGLVGGFLG